MSSKKNRNQRKGGEASSKECNQCEKVLARDQFSSRQWKKSYGICRLCSAYTKVSEEKYRVFQDCKVNLPRTKFAIFQWSKGEGESICHHCADALTQKVIDSLNCPRETIECPDGTILCEHSLESCDTCMVDYSLMNALARKRNELGKELTEEEKDDVIAENTKDTEMHINKNICIMDSLPMCPRSGRKMRCPCHEVTYCSVACQKHHWMIHKMTCKWYAEKEEKKARKKREKELAAANALTEDQKDFARMEAFFAENSGEKHSIDECAWQLGEHPFVIGGGSVRIGSNGEEFVKGDVAKIIREHLDVEWNGSPRFGLDPYVQKKPRVDWITKAREGKSQKRKDLEMELLGRHL